jgi:acetolactate synthase small subunit
MDTHFTLYLNAHNDHAVLQRILLVFSRRRLRLRALQFFDLDPARPADMQFELPCTPEQARELVAQLSNIVEVIHVWSEETPVTEGAASQARLAAA